jgi:homoserine kinase type II
VKVVKPFAGRRQELFIAIYQYLPGDDKYGWDNPSCSLSELSQAAEVLAMYHNTIFGWRDTTGWTEPGIIEQIASLPALWKACIDAAGGAVFDRVLEKQMERLNRSVDLVTTTVGKTVYETLPHLIIHGDFHPGNLKFQNENVVGLFDFDWSMSEARCFDVGLALIYFCSAWGSQSDGDLMLDRVDVFLNQYQARAQEMRPVGAMEPIEMQYLPQMILAGALYVLHWVIHEYYTHLVDPDEYLRYLKHGVRSIEWLEHHWNTLVEKINGYSD